MPRVLIVDDDATLREAFGLALQSSFDTDIADSADHALELTKANNPDVIVLDMVMTGKTGVDFLREYGLDKHPDTKVIVFTNSNSSQLEHEAKELGAKNVYLKSSFTPGQLVELVNKTIKS